MVLVCDDEPRDVVNSAPGKRRISSAENKCADAILSDKTGVIFVSFWGVAAVQICDIWRQVVNRRKAGEMLPCVVDLSKVRVQGLPRDHWNGESAARIRRISTIEAVGAEGGTKISHLKQATADNLTIETFTVPPSDCCVTEFRPIRHKLKAPVRLI